MPIPRRQRQWEIYRANLGESADSHVLVISSDETNAILEQQVIVCELVLASVQPLPGTPVTLGVKAGESGLPEDATISVATLASIPRGCLVELEGRLDTMSLRLGVGKAVQILVGQQRWP